LARTSFIAGTDNQVEERPSITYADVGGCKEQIEKLREVVELPLLEVSLSLPDYTAS
jgi:ATP-dependent 26S proteasome regulatory subunit